MKEYKRFYVESSMKVNELEDQKEGYQNKLTQVYTCWSRLVEQLASLLTVVNATSNISCKLDSCPQLTSFII